METNARNLFNALREDLSSLVSAESLETVIFVLLILILGSSVVRLLLNAVRRISRKGMPQRTAQVVEKAIKYIGFGLVFITAGKRAGIDISAILGAAGIAGIALGFAAQTSVANIISGLFLFSEHAFKIGDTLQVDNLTGIVETVDFMCVRIRTFDNRLVRVPNETLIKSNIINVTFFPQRRLDLWITVPCTSDLEMVKTTLTAVLKSDLLVLPEPEPLVLLDSITPDGIIILAGAWMKQENLAALKNSLIPAIVSGLAAKGVEVQARRLEVTMAGPSVS